MSDEAIKRKAGRFSLTIYIAHAYACDWTCKKWYYTCTLYSVAMFNVQASNLVADLEFTHDH